MAPSTTSRSNADYAPLKDVFILTFSALWTFLQNITSALFSILSDHFSGPMRRAIIVIGHVLIRVAVVYASACIVAAGVGKFADYACSFPVISRLPVCRDTPLTWSDAVAAHSPHVLLDPSTRAYEKLLDESAHGAPLALNLVKVERLVVEMANVVDMGPLSSEFKLELRAVLQNFEKEAKVCQAELESLDSQAVGLVLRLVTSHDTPNIAAREPLKEPLRLSLGWRRVVLFIAQLFSSEEVVPSPAAPEPLDFARAMPQVDTINHRVQGLQDALVYLHRSISKENARIREEEEKMLSSWVPWGKRDQERRFEQIQNFLSTIDHRRKQGLAHLDAVDNSLRSYQLDILDITSVSSYDSPRYRLFRVQGIIQRLGHQPILPSQLGTRGTIDSSATNPVEYSREPLGPPAE